MAEPSASAQQAKRRKKSQHVATIAIHGGDQHDPGHGAIFPPITTASTFIQPNLGEEGKFAYSRCGNPTRSAYETALMDLEDGVYCTATASGMAATSLALELLDQNSHLIVMSGVYGGTHRLFEQVRRRSSGLDFTYLNLNDVEQVCSSIRENTRMIWLETPTNPLCELVDIGKLVAAVRAKQPDSQKIIICADNTFATAWNQQPLKMGADLVMLSASKFIGGHSDMIGGALITNNEAIGAKLKFLKSAVGVIAGPFDAYLALRGLKTLDVRMERQCSNAQKVAEFLDKHPQVMEVYYPGLQSSPSYKLCKAQMRSGGAVVTIRLCSKAHVDDAAMMRDFFAKLQFWVLAESLGGVESMINHTATMSHGSMTQEGRAAIGIHDTTLRLSVGLEDVRDLIEDLRIALSD